jgi:hypothetical protein
MSSDNSRNELTTLPITIGIALPVLTTYSKILIIILKYLSNPELLMRIELTTSSLPRKCSTPELQQLERRQDDLPDTSGCSTPELQQLVGS